MAKNKKVKKDFDKDRMYRKIMPSFLTADKAPPAEEEPVAETPPEVPQLHNYMEDMVGDRLEHTMKVLEACDCDRCRKDIIALALNQLPTAYAVPQKDRSHYIKKLKGTYEVKVTSALIRAIQEVKKNPRH